MLLWLVALRYGAFTRKAQRAYQDGLAETNEVFLRCWCLRFLVCVVSVFIRRAVARNMLTDALRLFDAASMGTLRSTFICACLGRLFIPACLSAIVGSWRRWPVCCIEAWLCLYAGGAGIAGLVKSRQSIWH